MRPPSRRRAAGFTLLETLIALGVLALAMMALSTAYFYALAAQQDASEELSSRQASANLDQVLISAVRSATCILEPAVGGSGDVLTVYGDRDCAGSPVGEATDLSFHQFCRQGALILYATGKGTPGAACAPGTGSSAFAAYQLTPLWADASRASGDAGIFRRTAAAPNVVSARIALSPPTADGRARAQWRWEASLQTQTPLDSP